MHFRGPETKPTVVILAVSAALGLSACGATCESSQTPSRPKANPAAASNPLPAPQPGQTMHDAKPEIVNVEYLDTYGGDVKTYVKTYTIRQAGTPDYDVTQSCEPPGHMVNGEYRVPLVSEEPYELWTSFESTIDGRLNRVIRDKAATVCEDHTLTPEEGSAIPSYDTVPVKNEVHGS